MMQHKNMTTEIYPTKILQTSLQHLGSAQYQLFQKIYFYLNNCPKTEYLMPDNKHKICQLCKDSNITNIKPIKGNINKIWNFLMHICIENFI